jgi:predicted outer membrane repeat protein
VYCSLNKPTACDNCLFYGNTAQGGSGGAIYVGCDFESATVRLRNCTFTQNTAQSGGAIGWASFNCSDSDIVNCIFWGNSPDEIDVSNPATAGVSYSDVQDGWSGTGNIDADPLFCAALEGNLRLSDGSPCIDAADSDAVADDLGDVDDDGVTEGQTLPWDGDTGRPQSHHGRFFDVDLGPVPDAAVDMGAYENQHISGCPWDIAGAGGAPPPDGDVGVNDFLRLSADWNFCPGCGADFNCDQWVTIVDFLELQANWGPCSSSSAPESGGGSIEIALWVMGFTDIAAYEAWTLEATDVEMCISLQVLGELLVMLD